MKTCAVIIAAYNCPEYIMDCYNSVKNQLPLEGWNYEIRIGVDGCQKTADVLIKNKIPFYYTQKNVGCYIMRNSLIYLKKADAYAYFDADDVMKPDYLKASLICIEAMMLHEKTKTGFKDHKIHCVMTGKYQTDHKLNAIKTSKPERGGAITFSHYALEKVGGFYGARCACDTDFMLRLDMAGIKIYEINEPLYYRRRHAGSLTKRADTGMGSDYRKKIWNELCNKRAKGIVKIQPTVIKLEKNK